MSKLLALAALLVATFAHEGHDHDQSPISGPHPGLWFNGMSLPGDGETQVSSISSQITRQRADKHSRLTPSSPASRLSVVCSTIHVLPAML